MAIDIVPYLEPIVHPLERTWRSWFESVVQALTGWRLSRYHRVTATWTGTIPAQGTSFANVTVPGVQLNDLCLIGPDTGYGGYVYTAYVAAADIVTFNVHNYGPLPVLGFSKDFTMITFRQ